MLILIAGVPEGRQSLGNRCHGATVKGAMDGMLHVVPPNARRSAGVANGSVCVACMRVGGNGAFIENAAPAPGDEKVVLAASGGNPALCLHSPVTPTRAGG